MVQEAEAKRPENLTIKFLQIFSNSPIFFLQNLEKSQNLIKNLMILQNLTKNYGISKLAKKFQHAFLF